MKSQKRRSRESNRYSSDDGDGNSTDCSQKSEYGIEVLTDLDQFHTNSSVTSRKSHFEPSIVRRLNDEIDDDGCIIGKKAKTWTKRHLVDRKRVKRLGPMRSIDSGLQVTTADATIGIRLQAVPLRTKPGSTRLVDENLSDDESEFSICSQLSLPKSLSRRLLMKKDQMKSSIAGVRTTRRKTVHFGLVEALQYDSDCELDGSDYDLSDLVEVHLSSGDEGLSSGDEGIPVENQNSIDDEPYSNEDDQSQNDQTEVRLMRIPSRFNLSDSEPPISANSSFSRPSRNLSNSNKPG